MPPRTWNMPVARSPGEGGSLPIFPVVRRCRIELPAVLVPLGDLALAFEFLVVLILHADRAADVVDDVLIWRGIVTPRCFITDAVGRLPIRIDITSRQLWTGFGVLLVLLEHLAAPRPRSRCRTIQVERRRRRRHALVVRGCSPLPGQAGCRARRRPSWLWCRALDGLCGRAGARGGRD